MKLQEHVALVTGAGQGIGRAIALRFAREGAAVAIADIDAGNARRTADEIRGLGRRSFARTTDVADYDEVQALVAETVEALGKVDILVNNAGIGEARPFLEITKESWQRHIDVHLSGSFYCAQAAARDMAGRGYGRIVNIASVAALMGPINLAAYGAAKAGITGLTRAAALDLGDHGITVNAIAPGPIETDLLRTWPADALRERAQHMPIARLGGVEEIARAASFLASPDAGFITGTVLVVDGGGLAAGSYMVEKYRQRKQGTGTGSAAS